MKALVVAGLLILGGSLAAAQGIGDASRRLPQAQPQTAAPAPTTAPAQPAFRADPKWPQEPSGVRGIVWGTKYEALSQPMAETCRERSGKWDCSGIRADHPDWAETETWTIDPKDGLVSVSWSVPYASLALLQEQFVAKFGRPHETRAETRRNGYGVKFEGVAMRWAGRSAVVQVVPFGFSFGGKNYGLAVIQTAADAAKDAAADAAARAKSSSKF